MTKRESYIGYGLSKIAVQYTSYHMWPTSAHSGSIKDKKAPPKLIMYSVW